MWLEEGQLKDNYSHPYVLNTWSNGEGIRGEVQWTEEGAGKKQKKILDLCLKVP